VLHVGVVRVAIGAGKAGQHDRVPGFREIQRCSGLERLHFQLARVLIHQVRAPLQQIELRLDDVDVPLRVFRTLFSMTTTSLGCVTAK
jgi:hypothetical protein